MQSRAFTLIELLVVLAIMSVLSGLVVSFFTSTSQDAKLDAVANDIVSFMRKARQNAVSVLEHPNQPGVYPSYGIHFDTSSASNKNGIVILYADCKSDDNDSGQIELTDIFTYNSGNCSSKGKIEELILKNGVTVENIEVLSVDPARSGTYDWFNILFIRPEPTIWAAGKPKNGPTTNIDAGKFRITISDANNTETRVITLNSVGLITIE